MFGIEWYLDDIGSRVYDKHFNLRFALDLFIDYLKKDHMKEIDNIKVSMKWNSVEVIVNPIKGIVLRDEAESIERGFKKDLGFLFDLNKVMWRVNRYYECKFTIW